jgi:membrane-associated protease RseP (regulator of RpoE activity)
MFRLVTLLCLLPGLLLAQGYPNAEKPMLGVNMSPPPMSKQKQENLRPDEGVYIRRVYNGTAAENMGIQRGDVILEINGNPISSMSGVRDVISSHHTGSDVSVRVRRNGQDVQLSGTLGTWPESIPKTPINSQAEERYRSMQERRLQREARRAEQQLEQLEEAKQSPDGLTPLQRKRRQQLAKEADSELARALASSEGQAIDNPRNRVIPDIRIPEAAGLLPSWELRFHLHAPDDRDQPPDRIREIQPDPLLSRMVTPTTWQFAFTVNPEML